MFGRSPSLFIHFPTKALRWRQPLFTENAKTFDIPENPVGKIFQKRIDNSVVLLYYLLNTRVHQGGTSMSWKLDTDRPIFIQLVEILKTDILSGKLSPGDKISTVRDLAQEAAVNPNTMQRAMTELERLGLVYTERTSGRFVTKDEELIRTLKKEQAEIVIKEFIERMNRIGYQNEELPDILKETLKRIERSKE